MKTCTNTTVCIYTLYNCAVLANHYRLTGWCQRAGRRSIQYGTDKMIFIFFCRIPMALVCEHKHRGDLLKQCVGRKELQMWCSIFLTWEVYDILVRGFVLKLVTCPWKLKAVNWSDRLEVCNSTKTTNSGLQDCMRFRL